MKGAFRTFFKWFLLGLGLAAPALPANFSSAPELRARKLFCAQLLGQIANFKNVEPADEVDSEMVASKSTHLVYLMERFFGVPVAQHVKKEIEEGSLVFRSASEVIDWFLTTEGISGEIAYLQKVYKLLKNRQLTFLEDVDAKAYPYFVDKEVHALAGNDRDKLELLKQEVLSVLQRQRWNVEKVGAQVASALDHVAGIYGRFLIGRERFIQEPITETMLSGDFSVFYLVDSIDNGFQYLCQYLTRERVEKKSADELVPLIRMAFVYEMFRPNSLLRLEAKQGIKMIPWLTSMLVHPDRRDRGVRYAAGMLIRLIHFQKATAALDVMVRGHRPGFSVQSTPVERQLLLEALDIYRREGREGSLEKIPAYERLVADMAHPLEGGNAEEWDTMSLMVATKLYFSSGKPNLSRRSRLEDVEGEQSH